ncbi:MAG: septum formation initiator family protein [Clostridia bacterium]|nr:septum formation initiator family protein [Clostridia bacterium]
MAEKKSHRISYILTFVIAVFCIYLAVSMISLAKDIKATKEEITAVNTANAQLAAENDSLRDSMDSGNIDKYVERIARDEMGYVKPGERVYYDVSSES